MLRIRISILIIISLFVAVSANAGKKSTRTRLNTFTCDKSLISFDDGDSFSCADENIRVLGIDTPEIKHPSHGIYEDQEKGQEAKDLTRKLLEEAKRITIVRGGRDIYGRTLAHVLLDGELLGVKLIKAGLAYENVSHFGYNGLPEFALAIKEAAKSAPSPSFEQPHLWRRKHQKKTSR